MSVAMPKCCQLRLLERLFPRSVTAGLTSCFERHLGYEKENVDGTERAGTSVVVHVVRTVSGHVYVAPIARDWSCA